MTAVAVYEALAAAQTQPLPGLLRGAPVVALSCTPAAACEIKVVRDLKGRLLGSSELNGAGRPQAGSMACALRPSINVH